MTSVALKGNIFDVDNVAWRWIICQMKVKHDFLFLWIDAIFACKFGRENKYSRFSS